MINDYSKVVPKSFEFNNRFTSGNYTLNYSRHTNDPRINREETGLVIKESRIISAFTLDRIDKLINQHIIKMFVTPGKWKFFVESDFGLILFIVLTRKIKKSNSFIAEFHSSYTMDTAFKDLSDRKKQDIIMLEEFLICEKKQTSIPTQTEFDTYIVKEKKEISARDKKKARDDRKWGKRKQRKEDGYKGFWKIPYNKGKVKVYIPLTKHLDSKEVKKKRNYEKTKYDDYSYYQ